MATSTGFVQTGANHYEQAYEAAKNSFEETLQDLIDTPIPDIRDLMAVEDYLRDEELLLTYSYKNVVQALEEAIGDAVRNSPDSLMRWVEEKHDLRQAVREREEVTEELKAAANEVAEDVRRQQGKLGENWKRGRILGKGAFGKAFVYVEIDEHNTIIDRIAAKDARADYKIPSIWNSMGRKILPTEVIAMRRLEQHPASRSCIAKLRNWVMDDRKRMYRIFMEFCPYKTLYDLGQAHADVGLTEEGRRRSPIPEPFLWSVFERLTNAGLLMEQGSTKSWSAIPGWELIVHRDIRLTNVFLGENNSMFQGYPAPKVGDFGLSCFVPDNPKSRDWYTYNKGSWFQWPPELCGDGAFLEGAGPDNPHHYSSKSNVWQVGNTIWCLVELSLGDIELENIPTSSRTRIHAAFSRDSVTYYSKELLSLVEACIGYLPRDRPTFDEIRMRILDATGFVDGIDHAAGLRGADVEDTRWKQFPLIGIREEYKLGTTALMWGETGVIDEGEMPPVENLTVGSPTLTQDAGADYSLSTGERMDESGD